MKKSKEMDTLARTLDQSILKPASTNDEIKKAANYAKKYGLRSLVVHPCKVNLVKNLLAGTNVLTVAVSDFPHGRGLTKIRQKEVKELLDLGVDEIDIVGRYERLLEGDYKSFEDDLRAVIEVMNSKSKRLKIILEVDLLNKNLIQEATKIISKIAKGEKNSKLVIKTKTGFTENKMHNLEAVEIIKKTLEETQQYGKDKIMIKASGGIKTTEDAIQLLEAGVHILGTSNIRSILSLTI